MNDLNAILDRLTPQGLARLAVAIENITDRNEDFLPLHKLSTAVFDAGTRNCGDDFAEAYFEAHEELTNVR